MIDKVDLQLAAKDAEKTIEKRTRKADEPKIKGTKQKAKTNKLPKTQQELNAIIKERIARDRKQMRAKLNLDLVEMKNHAAQFIIVDYIQNDELNKTKKELIATKAELQAVKLNFRSCAREDAVYLAMGYLQKNTEEIDDGTICDALKRVLSKYPGWAENDKNKGGFNIGAPK